MEEIVIKTNTELSEEQIQEALKAHGLSHSIAEMFNPGKGTYTIIGC